MSLVLAAAVFGFLLGRARRPGMVRSTSVDVAEVEGRLAAQRDYAAGLERELLAQRVANASLRAGLVLANQQTTEVLMCHAALHRAAGSHS